MFWIFFWGRRKEHSFKKNVGSFQERSNHSLNEKVHSPFQRTHCGHKDDCEIKASLLQNSSLTQKIKLFFFFLNYEVTEEERGKAEF